MTLRMLELSASRRLSRRLPCAASDREEVLRSKAFL
jgi:hypothetical protein